jgi:hypothetical protein
MGTKVDWTMKTNDDEAMDLWLVDEIKGTAAKRKRRAPYEVLTEQARELEQTTKGLVRGDVHLRAEIELAFYLRAPRLQNYRYAVCRVAFSVPSLYPAQVRASDGSRQPRRCKTANALARILREMLQSPPATEAIASVIRDSAAPEGSGK